MSARYRSSPHYIWFHEESCRCGGWLPATFDVSRVNRGNLRRSNESGAILDSSTKRRKSAHPSAAESAYVGRTRLCAVQTAGTRKLCHRLPLQLLLCCMFHFAAQTCPLEKLSVIYDFVASTRPCDSRDAVMSLRLHATRRHRARH